MDKLQHLLTWAERSNADWEHHLHATQSHRDTPGMRKNLSRCLGLVFFNPSLRTRTSMEVAAAHLGVHVTTIIPGSGAWQFEWRDGVVMDGKEPEHIREAIGVLSRYYDALGVRIFASGSDLTMDRNETLFRGILASAGVPVINLESAFYHPCQALGDAAMLREHFGGATRGQKLVIAWCYHPKALPLAVPHSALLMASRLGMDVTIARPEGFDLDASVMDRAGAFAEDNGGSVSISADLAAAVRGASVLYAKAWGGMRRYADADGEAIVREQHRQWRVTEELMQTMNDGIFVHCLPARRGVVVDDDVLDGHQARHLLQAEYRLHAQKAILDTLLS